MTTIARRNQNWLPYIFNDFFENDFMNVRNGSTMTPAINVKETKENYLIEVAAPGMTKEDFNVSLDNDNNIVISMEKKNEKNEESKDLRYLRREFSYSKFQQTMILPEDVNKDKINAKVENGVLEINLPKLSIEDKKISRKKIEIC